ncbi:MAG TPA: glycosyltransferase [Baekduia sp.]|uniref:glycosyltransferase n=1 Tax=Baekduia sp. TaxID=2600305 RepID=UPI002CDF4CFD|nr:glycosyltransferase [Baekduia sp.]HMJ33104.1 glycosyltransferase [Baekduia sp.]
MTPSPRVTLGVATYSRDTYLAEAVASCLAQDYEDLEVLVVVDGSVNPRIDEILATFDDPRLRVVRHEVNRGIAEAYNTIIREGRGELIAMLGDDDVSLPDRISRSVAIFDAHPDTGIVHGNATIVDERGVQRGRWQSRDFTPAELMRHLVREHCTLVDPSRMVHRRVYEAVGGYAAEYTVAQDFHFWLRAAPEFRFRHAGAEPLIHLRRHGDNGSGDDTMAEQVEQVGSALLETVDRIGLRRLVPEVDWAILHPDAARRRALELLAGAVERRALPLPRLARRLRRQAAGVPAAPAPRRDKGRLLMTAFGWNDSGGGTMLPRFAAKELVRRGWDVTVFHAAVAADPSGVPYALREWEEDGVRLVGVHNRPSALYDTSRPDRELDDPPITTAFADVMDRLRPDVVHFHNLHNLGAELIDVAAARGVPSYFTTHNYWLVCPRAYLLRGDGALCDGPGDRGADCATCLGSHDAAGYQARLAGIRDRASRGLTTVLTISDAVRRVLIDQGYPADMLDVVRQSVPAMDEAWERVGRDRRPGRRDGGALTVGFFGSAYAHKGPQLLVEAAQRTQHRISVRIHGELPAPMRQRLEELDGRGAAELHGTFSPDELPGLLAGVDAAALPSVWWDCANLAARECLAARVPLLAPRMAGLAEAITDGVDGLAFDGGDVDGLARQLDRLASEPGLLEQLQRGIEAPRSFARFIDDYEAYYAGARPGRVGPDGEPPLAVAWTGDQDAPTSLAHINREVCDVLEADPSFVVRRRAADRPAPPAPLPHTADVEVRHAWPPDLRPPASGHLALVQPWEFGSIPAAWVEPLKTVVDELWVPSEHVRAMYLDAGLDGDRVAVVPNGVDLERFAPEGPKLDLHAPGLRLLFVGGAIARKGIDLLLDAYGEAFAGRDDVTLVVKDFGADGVYRNADRAQLERMAAGHDPAHPRVVHLTEVLSADDVAALYRSCDVLVHPYRGEGFAMPVLEAMACGLPSVVTAGGPTDEFCPAEAGWRIPSVRALVPGRRIGDLPLAGEAWMLEPDRDALVALLRDVAAAGADELRRRGAIARAAAEAYGWDAVGRQYAQRLHGLAARPPRLAAEGPYGIPFDGQGTRLLALPAFRGADRLAELLAAWASAVPAGTPATLVLVADPDRDGAPEQIEGHVVAAAQAAGVDLDACADVEIHLLPATAGRDAALHAGVDGFVPLHGASAGHARRARAAGTAVVEPDAASIAAFLAAAARAPALAT